MTRGQPKRVFVGNRATGGSAEGKKKSSPRNWEKKKQGIRKGNSKRDTKRQLGLLSNLNLPGGGRFDGQRQRIKGHTRMTFATRRMAPRKKSSKAFEIPNLADLIKDGRNVED